MRLALLYYDCVSSKMELVDHLTVYDDEDDSAVVRKLLMIAQAHSDKTQPRYDFDWSFFITDRIAASEDDDYRYRVVVF